MVLEVPLSLQPMEAIPVEDLPTAKGWLFEPKYDGFRCILFRDQDTVNLQSRRQRPLGRYFPEIIEATRHLPVQRFVFDGELIIPMNPLTRCNCGCIRQNRGFGCCRTNIPPK